MMNFKWFVDSNLSKGTYEKVLKIKGKMEESENIDQNLSASC